MTLFLEQVRDRSPIRMCAKAAGVHCIATRSVRRSECISLDPDSIRYLTVHTISDRKGGYHLLGENIFLIKRRRVQISERARLKLISCTVYHDTS